MKKTTKAAAPKKAAPEAAKAPVKAAEKVAEATKETVEKAAEETKAVAEEAKEATAEAKPFSPEIFEELTQLARSGVAKLVDLQKTLLKIK